MNKLFLLILTTSLSLTSVLKGQDKNYYDDSFLRYDNHIYKESIKTVQLFRDGWRDGFPLINLNSAEQLVLTFEDLSGLVENYAYSFVHCDANWKPSQLMPMEYLEGIQENLINNYEYSGNTRQQFIRYTLRFPNQNIKLTKSGNYLLKVFDMQNDELVLTRQFFVVENRVNVNFDIKRATQARYRLTHHEVDFSIQPGKYNLTNPYTDMKTVILQNHDWQGAMHNLKPTFVKSTELVFNYDDRNLFPGLNNWRFFDTRNLNYSAENTREVEVYNNRYNVFLEKDEPRKIKQYLDRGDINGGYLIRNDDRRLNDILEADYAWVHFALPYPQELKNGNLYIYGELSNWRIRDEFKLKYNSRAGQYETKLYLKQGYYNYLYMYTKEGSDSGDLTFIDGSHAQAENDYSIFVYHRQNSDIYDRLVGFNSTSFPR